MDLSALKDALQGLSDIGKKEKTFEVGGVSLTIRTLLPPEEIEIQKVSRENLDPPEEGKEPDQASVMTFIDDFRRRTLAYSIVAVGNLNFRNEPFVFTGEVLPDGTKIKIPKEEAVFELLGDFPRTMLAAIFDQYTQLSELAERETEKALGLEPTDVEAEIERLTERIEELKSSQQENYSDSTVASSIKVARSDTKIVEPPKAEPRKPVAPPKAQPPVTAPTPDPQEEIVSSMVGSDPMEAIQRETERLQRERMKGMPAPHTQAKVTSDEVFKKEGQIEGVEVFRMPTQSLSVAGPTTSKEAYVSSTNPNFKPSK